MLILNKNQIFKLDFVAVFIARYKFQSNLVDSILTMSMWAIDIENYSMLMYFNHKPPSMLIFIEMN